MMTIGPWKTGEALVRYHETAFMNGSGHESYYAADAVVTGQWLDTPLTQHFGLSGDVDPIDFASLAHGYHPQTGVQLIKHQTQTAYTNRFGRTIKPKEHRGGMEFVFSADKSFSDAWAKGGNKEMSNRLIAIHRHAYTAAITEVFHYAQARLGNTKGSEATPQQVVACVYDHTSSRPAKVVVDGLTIEQYAAPQVHSHVIVFNMAQRSDGTIKPLQTWEMFKAQRLGTAVYRNELALGLARLGFETSVGPSGEPRIVGFTQEYLDATSPRRKAIQQHLADAGRTGAKSAQIAALATRSAKMAGSAADMREKHAIIAAHFGNQPQRAVAQALARGPIPEPIGTERDRLAERAVTFGKNREFERSAVVDDRDILASALVRAMGHVPTDRIKDEFVSRQPTGEFLERSQPSGVIAKAWTTPEMVDMEQEVIDRMLTLRSQCAPMVPLDVRVAVAHQYPFLNEGQREALEVLSRTPDQVVAMVGPPGTGKTTTLDALRVSLEQSGYFVTGVAPSTTAAKKLQEAGLQTMTLQKYVRMAERGRLPEIGPQVTGRVVIADESSLASTVQMRSLLRHLEPTDRVVLVGDKQHQSIEAGRPFEQLIDHGLTTARLTTIMRQQDPDYLKAVERLVAGDIEGAVADLDALGWVKEIPNASRRLKAIAKDVCDDPDGALVIEPHNDQRRSLNALVHQERSARGVLTGLPKTIDVLVERQELTGPDRAWAGRYQVDDWIRYASGSAALGIAPGSYAQVLATDHDANAVTVRHEDGRTLTYRPDRLRGVSLYREDTRTFAEGDRIQFTQPYRDKRIANGELGTVTRITGTVIYLRTDDGQTVQFPLKEYRHLDYGYAVTSYRSQSLTARREIVDIDTDQPGAVGERLTRVALTRGVWAVTVYTNDAEALPHVLSRDQTRRSAIEQTPSHERAAGA